MKTTIPKELFHYCPLSSLFGIVRSNNLRLRCSKYSNDPNENLIGENVLREILKENTNVKEKKFLSEILTEIERGRDWSFYHTPYVFCMSTKSEDLNQWRIYADNGRGFCIGLKPSFFINTISSFGLPEQMYDKLYLNKCNYDHDEQKNSLKMLLKFILQLKPDKQTDKVLAFIFLFKIASSFFKDISYKDEDEWRLVCFPQTQQSNNDSKYTINYLSKNSVIIPYIEFPIDATFENPLFSNIFIGSNVINTGQELSDFMQNNKAHFRKLLRSKVKIQEIH